MRVGMLEGLSEAVLGHHGSCSRKRLCVFSHQACVYMLCICMCSSRYNELLFIIDTCQGASMYERFYSPNLMALASSQVGEDSLSVSHACTYRRVELKIHHFVRLSNELCGLTKLSS